VWKRVVATGLVPGMVASMGSTFPVIPSINSHGGTDDEGNYLTLLATDSEGNAVVFSEYKNY
jgi:hypothetical protein